MLIRWAVGVALLFAVLLAMLPRRDEASLARIASQAMLMCTQDFRAEVARRVMNHEAVTLSFANNCPDLIAALRMDERGVMVLTGSKYPVKVTLTPVVRNGKVVWSCRGEPAVAVTKLCRPLGEETGAH